MSDTVLIRNKRDVEVDIPDVGVVEPGGTIEVPAELANGTPPTGQEGTPDYHPGVSGLLAQTDAWEKARGKHLGNDKAPSGEED